MGGIYQRRDQQFPVLPHGVTPFPDSSAASKVSAVAGRHKGGCGIRADGRNLLTAAPACGRIKCQSGARPAGRGRSMSEPVTPKAPAADPHPRRTLGPWLAVAVVLAVQVGLLWAEGRRWWCACGQPNLWSGE